MILYGLKNCDTCRKAMKALGATYEVRLWDVRADGAPDFVAFYDAFGDSLLNTRSTTWRGLSEEERRRPVLDLLAEHPALMKRPVIVDGDRMTLGWDKAVQAEWLG